MRGRIFAAILSGALLVLSFAPIGLWPLAFVALVPLFISIDGLGARRAFLLGLISGLVFFTGSVYWVMHSMQYYGGLGLFESLPVMLLLAGYLALFFAFFTLLTRFTPVHYGGPLFFYPCLWVALEYMRGHLFTGFPWVLLGYSQAHNLILIQITDITGLWGLSFILILVNVLLFFFIRAYHEGAAFPLKPLSIVVVLISAAVLYGFVTIRHIDKEVRGWPVVPVAVAQGNIDQAVKWDRTYQAETLRIYSSLTKKAAEGGAKLVVWPETAVPFYLESNASGRKVVTNIAKSSKVRLLTGSPAFDYNEKNGEIRYYNSAYAISTEGLVTSRYDKVHLVPYGEYVPLKRFMPFIKKLTAGVGDFVPGPGPIPIKIDGYKAGILICYEAIFPGLARKSIRDGAGILVNITNDGWFGRTSAPYQHLDMTLLRAVENRVFLLRAANTGISAVVDPAGRVVKKIGLFTEDVALYDVSIKEGHKKTFSTAYGDVFAYSCIFFAGVVVIGGLFKKKKIIELYQ